MKKKSFYFLHISYNFIVDSTNKVSASFTVTTDTFPTMGLIVKAARKHFETKHNGEFVDDSVILSHFTEITAEQYEALNDMTVPAGFKINIKL